MNKPTAIFTAVLASAVCLASCSKHEIFASKGDSVLFSAGLGGSESATKTSYTDSNASDRSKAENINWLAGDQIRIWCAECSEPASHYADYTVTPESTATQGKIAVNPGTVGLRWGEAGTTHYFYAVYPSPDFSGKSSDAGTLGASETPTPFSYTGTIPQSQGFTVSTGTDKTVIKPDMLNLYMAAKANAKPNDSGSGVFLRFTPLTTAIQFTIKKDTANEDEVLYVALESDSHELWGSFSADIGGWQPQTVSGNPYTYPACTSMNSGESSLYKRVTINTDGQGIKVSDSKELTFTFFLLPTSDVDDLSFIISKKDSDGAMATLKTRLCRTDGVDGNKIVFANHKKTYVKGILVPDGFVTLSVTTSEYNLEDAQDPTAEGTSGDYDPEDPDNPSAEGDTGEYDPENPDDPSAEGNTGDYDPENPDDPSAEGNTGEYGQDNPNDPSAGGSTGEYGQDNPDNPSAGGSTGEYGQDNPNDPSAGGSTGQYGQDNPNDPSAGGSTGQYGQDNPNDPSAGGSTGQYGQDNPNDPSAGGSTGQYGQDNPNDPSAGGSTGQYGQDNPNDPSAGGSTGQYGQDNPDNPSAGGSTGQYGQDNPNTPSGGGTTESYKGDGGSQGGTTSNYNEDNKTNIFTKK